MRRSSILIACVVILSAWGAYVSAHLLGRHFNRSDKGWFSAMCDAAGGGCDTVLDSRWAYFPPRPEDEDREATAASGESNETDDVASQPATAPATQPATSGTDAPSPTTQAASQPASQPVGAARATLRVPVAFLGLVYFSALAIWFLCLGRPSYAGRAWHLVPLVVAALGLAGSIAFIVIMYTQVKAWCLWCLVSHASNVLMFPLIVALYPRRLRSPAQIETESTAVATASPESSQREPVAAPGGMRDTAVFCSQCGQSTRFPPRRLAVVTVLAIAAVIWAEVHWANGMAMTRENREYKRVLVDYMKDGEALYAAYLRNPRVDLKLRPGEHMRGSARYPLDAVMFGDFQCSHCRRMARFIEEVNRKAFKGSLRVVFKHYPLNQGCNPYVSQTVHPQACEASRAAEAAYLQGGNEAFWKAHDVLFAAQAQLARADYRTVAAKLGLDPQRFIRDMESQTVADRIAQDVELGKALGIKGTPRLFVSGREVPDLAMRQMPFWQTMSQAYTHAIQQQSKSPATSPHGH